MLFSEIIGQEALKKFLLATVKENRISHAQLFLGKEGYGALPLAIAYAQYIMCNDKKENDSCGVCSSCRKIKKLEHPDLHFAFPTTGTKNSQALISDDFISQWRTFLTQNPYSSYEEWLSFIDAGNSQGSIKVKEAENILRKLSLKSFESDFKIMIIWLPEKMNQESANKLLKLIEEPPEKTLFLLVSIYSELIISTILSRTQLIKIKPIKNEDIVHSLISFKQIDEQKAKEIARISEGDFNTACNLLEISDDAQQNFDFFTKMMRLSYMGKFSEIIKWVDDLSKIGRERQKAFLNYSLRMIRENLIINRKQKQLVRLSAQENDFSEKFALFIHPQNAEQLVYEVTLAHTHISRNANAKVVLLDMCIKINQLLKKEN